MSPIPGTDEDSCLFERDGMDGELKVLKSNNNELILSDISIPDLDKESVSLTDVDLLLQSKIQYPKNGDNNNDNLKINFTCELCGEGFANRRKLVHHLKVSHDIDKSSAAKSGKDARDPVSPLRTDKINLHKCDVCNKVYNHKSSLIKHNKLKHNIVIKKTFQCTECPAQFNSVYNLHAHIKRKHPKQYDSDEDEVEFESRSGNKFSIRKSNKNRLFHCDLCGRTFSHSSGLSYHKKIKHQMVVDRPFKCVHCDAKYAMKRTLLLHLNEKHSIVNPNKRRKFSKPALNCVLCSSTFPMCTLLCSHYTDAHKIDIVSETLEFSSFSLFLEWKQNLEKETNEKFILERGCQISKNKVKKHRYLCHRSGRFIRRGGGVRKLKNQGSKKINAHCPAMMAVTEYESGLCKAFVVKTHVGHNADLCHISLTAAERSQIADQIASKLPFEDILDKIKQSVDGLPSERLHLLKRKDLHNIEKEFNLSGDVEKHQTDALSVDAWVNDLSQQMDPCVLFYKAQGLASDVSDNFLKVEDFVLILMNNTQSEVLLKYSQDTIIVDSTYTKGNDFHLITLMIIDDLRLSFPAAFLVTSRIDEEILFLFYCQIRLKVGTIITNAFMSDLDHLFYSAWVKVMGQPLNRLWCSWRVDSAWRKNIKLKIKDADKQAETYKILRVLSQEKCSNTFMETLNHFVVSLRENDSLAEFNSFFSSFVTFSAHWAFCFRSKLGMSNDSHIERMHRTLRHIFVKGRRLKELAQVVKALMKLVHDRLYYRNLVLEKGNINDKMSIIKNRHTNSMLFPIENVIECNKSWQVLTVSDGVSESFSVSKNLKKLTCSCKLFCLDCKACIHLYNCECIDSSILGNMCEHIHLVCRFLCQKHAIEIMEPLLSAPVSPNLIEVDSYQIYVMPETPDLVAPAPIDDINLPTPVPDLMQRKENVINLFLGAVNSVTNSQQMAVIEKATANLIDSLTLTETFSS